MKPLTAEERAELRRLATADKSGTWFDMVAYIKATEPPTVLALLDALDEAEATNARLRAELQPYVIAALTRKS